MEKVSDKELMRQVMRLCGGAIDLVDIKNEKNLSVLEACLHHEIQHSNRATMIRNLKIRIRKLERKYAA